MKVIVGYDDPGLPLGRIIVDHCATQGYEVEAVEPAVGLEYPHIAFEAVRRVRSHWAGGRRTAPCCVLVCGTGIGMSIAANKVRGIMAALCHDPYSADRAVRSNNADLITMGARIIGPEVAKRVVDAYLSAVWNPASPSAAKVEVIRQFEAETHGKL